MLFLQISIFILVFIITNEAIHVTNFQQIPIKEIPMENHNINYYNKSQFEKKYAIADHSQARKKYFNKGVHDSHIKYWDFFSNVDEITLWPNGIVPYIMSDNLSAREKKLIYDAINEFHTKTCIIFRERQQNDQDYVEFKKSNSGCSTYIGKVMGRNLLDLDSACIMRRTDLLHQLMHVIGFFDQHSARNRDNWITIMWDNIQSDKTKLFEIPKSSVIESPYDYESIMHLNMYDFTNNRKETVIPKVADMNYIGPTSHDFTINDLNKINKMYKLECKLQAENTRKMKNYILKKADMKYINGSNFNRLNNPQFIVNNKHDKSQAIKNYKYNSQESFQKNENKRMFLSEKQIQNKIEKPSALDTEPQMICVLWPVSIDDIKTLKEQRKRNAINLDNENKLQILINNNEQIKQNCPEYKLLE